MEHTVRILLSIFGDFIGIDFREIFPGDEQYQSAVHPYLENSCVKEREVKLGVFSVYNIGVNPKPLGFLVLDLEERGGKPRGALCKIFASVCVCPFLV